MGSGGYSRWNRRVGSATVYHVNIGRFLPFIMEGGYWDNSRNPITPRTVSFTLGKRRVEHIVKQVLSGQTGLKSGN
jgi:hypothetical protein